MHCGAGFQPALQPERLHRNHLDLEVGPERNTARHQHFLNHPFANNAIDIGAITVVVVSQRVQCADPAFFEAFGLDIGKARVVHVKSRGHFRGGFDEFFKHKHVIEVDAPGLTSPILRHFAWKHLNSHILANWTA